LAKNSDEKVKGQDKPVEESKASLPDVPGQANQEVEPEEMRSKEAQASGGWKPVMPKDIKKAVIRAVIALAVLVLVTLITFGVLIYAYRADNPFVKAVSKEVPYPAEQVNGRLVSYYDYLFEVDANKRAYQNNAKLNNQQPVDFSSTDGKKLVQDIKQHALDKLKSDVVVAQLASDRKIKVTDKNVDSMINDLYKRYGGKTSLLNTINQIYAWNIDDLKGVIRKQLLAQKLQDAIANDPTMLAQTRAKANKVLDQIKAGGDFVELAKKNSQASDASSGGDLGTVNKTQLPTDIQKAVDALQVGQVSDLIKTQYGYEIIKLTAKDGDSIKGNHILTKTTDFNEYFNEQLKKAKSTVFIKIK